MGYRSRFELRKKVSITYVRWERGPEFRGIVTKKLPPIVLRWEGRGEMKGGRRPMGTREGGDADEISQIRVPGCV